MNEGHSSKEGHTLPSLFLGRSRHKRVSNSGEPGRLTTRRVTYVSQWELFVDVDRGRDCRLPKGVPSHPDQEATDDP